MIQLDERATLHPEQFFARRLCSAIMLQAISDAYFYIKNGKLPNVYWKQSKAAQLEGGSILVSFLRKDCIRFLKICNFAKPSVLLYIKELANKVENKIREIEAK